jgi:hypothetical protein
VHKSSSFKTKKNKRKTKGCTALLQKAGQAAPSVEFRLQKLTRGQ